MAGFRPIGHQTGGAGGSFKTRRYQKGAASEIFPGDPIRLLGSGLVERLNATTAASTPAQRACLGIAARIVADAEGKPKTFDTSGKSVYSPSAATGDWIEVYTDPGIIYEVVFETSAGQTEIGRLVTTTVNATALTSATGNSGFTIKASAPATANGGTFRIIDISPRALDQSGDKGSSGGLVLVTIDGHVFAAGHGTSI